MIRKFPKTGSLRQHDGSLDEGFYIYHVDHVRRRLRRIGIVGADVDDLVQQTFCVAQQCWMQRPVGDGRQRAWLLGIAWRLAMNLRRFIRGRQETLGVLPTHDADEATPEVAAQQRQICTVALAEMTHEEREMLCDYLVDGATVDEVAVRHGLARSTAWSKLQRLRRNALERATRLTA